MGIIDRTNKLKVDAPDNYKYSSKKASYSLNQIVDDVNTKSKRGTDNPIFEPDDDLQPKSQPLPLPPSPNLVAEMLNKTPKTTDDGVTSFIINETTTQDKLECEPVKTDYKFDSNMTSIINKAHHLIIDTNSEKCGIMDGHSSTYNSDEYNYVRKKSTNKRTRACQLRLIVWLFGLLAASGIIAVAMYYFVRYTSQQQYLLDKYREQYEKYEFEKISNAQILMPFILTNNTDHENDPNRLIDDIAYMVNETFGSLNKTLESIQILRLTKLNNSSVSGTVYQALIVVLFKRVSPLVQSDFQIKSFMRKSNVFADRKDFGTIGNDTDDDVRDIVDSIIAKIKRRFLSAYESDSNVKKFFIQNFNDIQIKINGNIENVTADSRFRQDGIEESPFVATPTQRTTKSQDLTKVPPTALPIIQTNQTESKTTANQLNTTVVKKTIEPTKSDTTSTTSTTTTTIVTTEPTTSVMSTIISTTTTTSTTIETTEPKTESTIITTSTIAVTAPTSTRTSPTIEQTTESTTTTSRKIEFTEQITTATTVSTPVTAAPTNESTITMPTKQSTESAKSTTQTSTTVEPTVHNSTITIATTPITIITSTSTSSSTVTTVSIGSTTVTTTTTSDINTKLSPVTSESTLATTSTTSTALLETSTILTKSTVTTEAIPIVSLKTVFTTTKTRDNITTSVLTAIQTSDSTNMVEPVSVNYLTEILGTTNLSSLSSNLLETTTTTTTTTVAYSPPITDKHVAIPIEKNSLAQRQYLAKLKHLSTGLEKTKSKAYFNQQAENTNQVKLKTSQNTEILAITMHQSSSTQPATTLLATMEIDFNSSTTVPLMEPSTIQATTASILADAKRRKLIKIFKNSRQE